MKRGDGAFERVTNLKHHARGATMIGPFIPAHLLKTDDGSEGDEEEAGPKLPAPEPKTAPIAPQIGPSIPGAAEEDDDEDSWAPELPPDLPVASSSRRVIGPSFPTRGPYDEDDDDDDFGPMPLPAGSSRDDEHDAVKEFIEREERRKKELEVCTNYLFPYCIALNPRL